MNGRGEVPVSRHAFMITVAGELDERLREEFDDVEITVDHSATKLRASGDASTLDSVVHRLDTLGLELLDVHQIDSTSA
jgi:hypothetical protein